MFTGIIEKTGKLIKKITRNNILEMTFRPDNGVWKDIVNGESIAVNGVCLTVVCFDSMSFTANVSSSTVKATNLDMLSIGDTVNLERCLRADSRIGGHFVQGHVDCTGRVAGLVRNCGTVSLKVEFPESLYPLLVVKGSIAVNGISLTIQELDRKHFTTSIVPFTDKNTNIQYLRTGCMVNLEADIFAKYIGKYLAGVRDKG